MAGIQDDFNDLFDDFLADPDFGPIARTATITITSGGTVDPITGDVTAGTTTPYTADGFLRSPREKEFREVVGGDIVFTVKQVDLAYTPVFGDAVVVSGGSTWDGTWTMQELAADGADVSYRMLLRR